MENINNIYVTVFIEEYSFFEFLEVIKILDTLPLENNYIFQPKDILYSFKSEYTSERQISVPLELWMKFEYKYNQLKRQ